MRKLLLSSVAAAALLGSSLASHAADLGQPIYKAPPPPPPVFTWTGFYFGSHAGCGWFETPTPTEFTTVAPISGFGHLTEQATGCFGGGQVGVNYQAPSNFVVGVEADASFGKISSFNSTLDFPAGIAAGWEDKLTAFGTVRGRLGYAINGGLPLFGGLAWMPYVTGGWAWGRNEVTVQGGAGTFTSDNQTLNGWTIGAGVEWAITSFLTWKAEYLYMRFDSANYAVILDDVPGVIPGVNFDRLNVNIVRTGLNWRFGAMPGY